MESHQVSLFETTWNISCYLPFIVLNFLSYYTIAEYITLDQCFPKWKNLTIRISKYLENIDDLELKPNNIILCKYFHPNDCVQRRDNYKTDLLYKMLLVTIPAKRREGKLKEGFIEITTLSNGLIIMIKSQ